MASRTVKAIRFTVAWLLVPAIFAAAGYYIIGPRLGASPSTPASVTEDSPDINSPSEEEPPSKNFKAPNIEVSVKKGSTVSQRDIRRPAPRKKRADPPKAAAPVAPTTEAPTAPSGGGETIPVGAGQ